MLIYLATSWSNPHTPRIKQEILALGHTCYHFLDSGHELDYNKILPDLRKQDAWTQAKYINHPEVIKPALVNVRALKDCSAFVLAEPAEKGSYTEFGMAATEGKRTILYVTPEYKLGVMDAVFDWMVTNEAELKEALE